MTYSRRLGAFLPFPWQWLAAVGAAWGAGAAIVMLTLQPAAPNRETRLCDRMVDALLHSKDLVEVTRAGIIVHEVNCGFWQRLEP